MRGIAVSRLVGRHLTQFGVETGTRWRLFWDLQTLPSIVLSVVYAANLAHLRGAHGHMAGLLVPDTERRPVSLLAVAEPLGLPYETVRRHARLLEERGLLRKSGRGWIVPLERIASDAGRALMSADADGFRRLVGILGSANLASAAALSAERLRAMPDDVLSRIWLDNRVVSFEAIVPLYGDAINALICTALVAANVAHLTADLDHSLRFARHDDVPLDSDRVPASLRLIARQTGLPFETVRRRVAILTTDGVIAANERGVIIPASVLGGVAYRESNEGVARHFDKMLTQLAQD